MGELFVEAMEQLAAQARELIIGTFQNGCQASAELSPMLRQPFPILGQQAADLVDTLSSAGDQPTADAVMALELCCSTDF